LCVIAQRNASMPARSKRRGVVAHPGGYARNPSKIA
jgi:hypothetical protein